MNLKIRYFFPLFLFLTCHLQANDQFEKEAKMSFDSYNPNSINWESLSGDETEEYDLYLEKGERENDFLFLFQAKNYLINGDLKYAKAYLDKIRDTSSKLSLIKKRYIGLIAFIQGDYNKSYQIYNLPIFYSEKYYSHVCIMKVISLLAMKEINKMQYELTNCRVRTSRFSSNEQIWLDSITDLALKKPYAINGGVLQSINFLLGDPEYLRIWLKLAIYLNQETVALKNISSLHENSYYSKKVREMAGLIHYRNKNYDLASKFIEDIDSANAENIKGNINLLKKEYELAYGHFKLALKNKENSHNAIERAIPLSWLLGLWPDALDLISRVIDKNALERQLGSDDSPGTFDLRKKIALESAVLLRMKNYNKTQKNLLDLKYMFKDRMPIEVEMMWTFNSLMLEDHKNLLKFSEGACRHFDGISCWIYLNIYQWENLPKIIKRDEETRQDKNFSVNGLKESQVIESLDEMQLVDQRDIEELDSNQIKIDL